MIPGKIFTGFNKFQGIVSVNDFRLPIGLQELFFFETQMNYEGSTHPMSRLRKDAKKSCQEQGPHANVLKTGRTQQCERQATEHVGKRGLPEGRQLGVDVGIQRPKDGGVARKLLWVA